MTKSELKEREGMYYIGDIVDIDGDGWVDEETAELILVEYNACLLYTSPSPRDLSTSRMPSSA